jgi:hypothetical protein
MCTAAECRAFADECLRRADRAKEGAHRKALLEMARSWADSATILERHSVLAYDLQKLTREARARLEAACVGHEAHLSTAPALFEHLSAVKGGGAANGSWGTSEADPSGRGVECLETHQGVCRGERPLMDSLTLNPS